MVTHQETDTPTYIKHLPLTLSFFKIQHLPFAFFTKCLLPLVKYGWKFSNDQAVLVIVETIFGGCRKECLSNRSKSFTTDLACTDLCRSFEEKDEEKHIFYIESDE